MKIALIGNGAMGQLVAEQAKAAGHEIAALVTSKERDLNADQLTDKISSQELDVAIDVSAGEAVLRNIEACARARVPLVEGTTGWNAHEAAAKQIVTENSASLVYGANFSIGVNLFYRIIDRAAALFASVDGYAPFIEEAHHMRKRDAPSGTALQLRELMQKHLGPDIADIPTVSTRAGYIPGTHRVGFDSEADQILLVHEARSRTGFASGALLAADWVIGRTGVFQFTDVIEDIVDF
ncbi:MAG TPA: dihydrodipicolinate reductase C-terminal domain-containing protein [Pyrinomonadaceae bacterium]|nr:dihydrodipicolinate reductase C-terminal domain-containing protein [Pyrinomonadaceae bacterium]